MKLKINATNRINRRYVLIEAKNKEIVEKIILDYIGIIGFAKSSPQFVSPSPAGKLILAINNSSLSDIRASLEMSSEKIKILKVSGTLKGLSK